MNLKYLEATEEAAFYESGLAADGCLEHLDDYARKAITRYGRLLVKWAQENQNSQNLNEEE
jgi:hypothetical protein